MNGLLLGAILITLVYIAYLLQDIRGRTFRILRWIEKYMGEGDFKHERLWERETKERIASDI
jgi:hypothetical protein